MSVAPLRIVSAGTERVDEVEPLWLAMHEVHVGAGPQAAEVRPFRAPAETWRRRRQVYERLLSDEGDGHLLLAEQDGVICGYAVLAFSAGQASIATGDRVAELESLSVLQDFRGRGIGSALMGEVRALAVTDGARELTLAVMDGNDAALSFYARFGMRPYVTLLLGALDA